jgi:aminoglycoside/choline kinase family phosphotransferase
MTAPITPTVGVAWADSARHAAFDAWLAPLAQKHQLLPATLRPASADASFRRYLRLDRSDGSSLIVMDAPPDKEDCAPFAKVQGLMNQAGLCVPQILDWDAGHGFMLLSDLGGQTVIEALNPEKPQDAEAWYRSAIEVLLDWQLASKAGNTGSLPL